MERACALLAMVGAGQAHGALVDCYPTQIDTVMLRLRRDRLAALLGTHIPDADVRRILDSLGFDLADVADGWDVTVPTRRVDAKREVDLIEEVARHYGYDRIPTTFPALEVAPQPIDPTIVQARHLRTVLTAAGFSEALTFGFIAQPAAARFAKPDDLVAIANPLSENFTVLRPSVLPGLLDAVSHNRRRQVRDVQVFEIGACFSRTHGERRAVGCAWTGAADPEHWSAAARAVDFFDIRGVVERLGAALDLDVALQAATPDFLTPGRAATAVSGGREVGHAGQLQPAVAAAHGFPDGEAVYVVELWLDPLTTTEAVRVRALPRHPTVTRDISILVADTVLARDVRATITNAAPDTLDTVVEFDRYQGNGVPDGQVSLSLHLTFRASDRTLTDGEVDAAMDAVVAQLAAAHQAIRR
jgi:phenylalanyl-tRNA synthetase beta chain